MCSEHFKEEEMERNLVAEALGVNARPKIKPGVIPTMNLPLQNKRKSTLKDDREARLAKRTRLISLGPQDVKFDNSKLITK